jgi:hypothetical protein
MTITTMAMTTGSPVFPREFTCFGAATSMSSSDKSTLFAVFCRGGDLDYTPDDDDDVATILPEAGGKRLAANVSPSKSSRASGATSSVGSIVDTPKFKPHPLGMDSVELQMLNQDILSLLFANPANKEGLKVSNLLYPPESKLTHLEQDICSEYGFQSPVDLKRMMTETIRRAADSNDGKFLTTSIEDPRKSYKPAWRAINDPDNPMNID